jgi:hypothetical protein
MFESPSFEMPKKEQSERKEQPKLSSDYDNIRNEAISMLEQRILLIKDSIGSDSPEIKKFKEATSRLEDNSFVLETAKANNWLKLRDYSDDEEIDTKLSSALMKAATKEN